MDRAPDIYLLDEFNWVGVLWRALTKRPALILSVNPVFSESRGLLAKFKSFAFRRGWAADAFAVVPALLPYRTLPWYLLRSDAFDRIEAQSDVHFSIGAALESLGEYGLPWAHVCNNRTESLLSLALMLNVLSEHDHTRPSRIFGVDRDLAAIFSALTGSRIRHRVAPSAILNFFFALLFCIYGTLWCLVRTRPRLPPAEPVFLGVDFVADPRLPTMIKDVVGDLGRTLFLLRNRTQSTDARARGIEMDSLRSAYLTDGRFTFSSLMSTLRTIGKDGWLLFAAAWRFETALFRSLGVLAVRRAMAIGFANRYRFSFFFGRDDYNVEHIIRSQELRRHGTVNMGISHGLPAPAFVDPIWRHIDFDVYFVFGKFQASPKCYGRTWPKHMEVEAAGTFGLSRDEFSRLLPRDQRPRDIVCYLNIDPDEDTMLEIAFGLARTFPEKKVYLRPKPGAIRKPLLDKIRRLLIDGPGNAVLLDGPDETYAVMNKSSYALCTASTVVSEAIQLGMDAFVFDFRPDLPLYFREFPGLCVKSLEDIASKIKAIEVGSFVYPRDAYRDLSNLSGQNVYDVICRHLGRYPMTFVNT